MKRVLVTGGAGFISSNFIRHLLEATPYEVVSLDALTYAGNLENLADVISHPRLSFVHGDIRDASLVRELVEGVDVIVNAAAESHVEKSIEHGASEFVTTNVEGTQILLDAIRVTPVERFILVSSSEVYGTAEYAPMDEEHPLNPRSPYAARRLAPTGSRTRTFDLRAADRDRAAVQQLRPAPASREGRAALHHAGALRRAADGPRRRAREPRLALRRRRRRGDRGGDRGADRRIAGEVLNVATGVDISVADIAELVLDVLGKPRRPRLHVDERPGQVDRHIGSTEKAERLLGWRARTSFEDGLERTVAWYRDNEAWWRGILARETRAFSS